MKKLSKLLKPGPSLVLGAIFLLISCGTSNSTLEFSNKAKILMGDDIPTEKNKLLELILKASTLEDSASYKIILPFLGINDAPPPILKSPGYSYASISIEDRKKLGMIQLGVEGISYSRYLPTKERPWEYFLDIRLDRQTKCITVKDVLTSFGASYEKLPPRIVAPMLESLVASENDHTPQNHATAGMLYKNLFHKNGEVSFSFEFKQCADSITLATRGKP